ncbi:MAG: RBBP9/YdeN family alpha/beta hydrolase [Candidatus Woesearchaeota archaeon]
MKTAIIVHGWDGDPNIGWFVWLEKELKKRGYQVIKPIMPSPAHPKINSWVNKLKSLAKDANEDTVLIGHSIGCQTIMRYLETSKAKKVGKVIFIAPWLTLLDAAIDETESYEIAKPWLETPIDFSKVRSKIKSSTAILSDNDPFVSVENADELKKRLGSKIIIEKNKGHYEEGKTKEIPVLMKEV